MSNLTPENEVKKQCLERLDQWQRWGVVVDYDDVSNLGRHMSLRTGRWYMHTKEGKRDLIVLFKVGRILWTYLVECKAADGGYWRQEQQQYALRFQDLDNVIYEVVSDSKQIDLTLEKYSGRTSSMMMDIDVHMGLITVEEE